MEMMHDAGALRDLPKEIVKILSETETQPKTRKDLRKQLYDAKDSVLRAGRRVDASELTEKFDGLTLKHWFTGQIRKIAILPGGEVSMTPVSRPAKKMRGNIIVRSPLKCLDWISNSSPV